MTTSRYDGTSIFHVGLIKTATTFLQERIFCRADLGIGLGGGPESRAHFVEHYLVCPDFGFDAQAVRARMDALEAPQRAQGLVPIWSEEMFLGDPVQRQYLGQTVLDRLRATHGGAAKLLLTVREQRAFALSAYQEYVLQGGRNPLSDFIGTPERLPGFTPILRESFLHFDQAVAAYIQAFGRENVLVLPICMLRNDPARYLALLGNFLGRPLEGVDTTQVVHKALGLTALEVLRGCNRFAVRSPLRPGLTPSFRIARGIARRVDRLVPASWDANRKRAMMAQINARYEGCFTESNRRLEALTGHDLKAYGYQ